MKIFRLLILLIFSNLLTSESEIEFSLNSDSIWRGITQNNGKPTVGANIYFSLDNGFFSGAWIENCCSGNSSYPNREIGYEFGYQKNLFKKYVGKQRLNLPSISLGPARSDLSCASADVEKNDASNLRRPSKRLRTAAGPCLTKFSAAAQLRRSSPISPSVTSPQHPFSHPPGALLARG